MLDIPAALYETAMRQVGGGGPLRSSGFSRTLMPMSPGAVFFVEGTRDDGGEPLTKKERCLFHWPQAGR